MTENNILDYINSQNVCVVGAGVSNMPIIRFLVSHGVRVCVRDGKSARELGERGEELEKLGVRIISGENYLAEISETVVVRSPGIRPDKIKTNGRVISEVGMFCDLTPAQTLAVTGSDGKTTTTTIIYKMLESQYKNTGKKVFLGGNIGVSLFEELPEMQNGDFSVSELSSFQLQDFSGAVDVAVVTNVTPNHLNWHTSMDEYINAKKNLLKRAKRAVLNYDNEITREMGRELDCEVVYFSSRTDKRPDCAGFICIENGNITLDGEKLLPRDAIKLPGRHNTENYMAALGAVYDKVNIETMLEIARSFSGVEHRIEFVRELDGVRYYNSSIDSTPTRTAAALDAFSPEKSITVILGGYDKHIPFEPLGKSLFVAGNVKTAVLTGATALKIKDAITEAAANYKNEIKILCKPDFDCAVKAARGAAERGGIVLLSPACASFDAFENFAERGRHFKELVKKFN